MRNAVILITFLFLSQLLLSQKIQDTTKVIDKVKSGNYIPYNLYDCFYTLDIVFDSIDKKTLLEQTEKEFTDNSHYKFGEWMYKNWQFKKESRIHKYFRSIGVYPTDNMLEIILNSYYKYFKDSTKNKEKLVIHYESYWKDASQKKRTDFPQELINPKKIITYLFSNPNGEPKSVSIFISKNLKTSWAYEPKLRWVQISEETLEKLKDIDTDTYEEFSKLYNQKIN